jgi:hypothetical protein
MLSYQLPGLALVSGSGLPAASERPAAARTLAAETGKFSSSLNFTATEGSAAIPRVPARHRTLRQRARLLIMAGHFDLTPMPSLGQEL